MEKHTHSKPTLETPSSTYQLLILIPIIALALNLRPAIASIGPIADLIQASTGMSSTSIGLLSTLPIFLMGIGALCVKWLRKSLGEERGISIGAMIIVVSSLARLWLNTEIGLMITAIGAGVGIATIQALMPAFIKHHFGHNTGRIIGFYSSAIVGGAVLSAAGTAEMANYFGFTQALAFWGIPALIGLFFWLFMRPHTKAHHQTTSSNNNRISFWKNSRSWSLLLFFGIGTGAFMLILAWLPPYYVEQGATREFAGYLLASFTLVELVTALVISTFIHRYPDRRGPLLLCLIIVIMGLIGLLVLPLSFALIATGLLGVGIGILFPLSLIITVDHISDPRQAGDFTAFVTGGGYIIASLVPLLAGWIREQFSDLSQIWLIMILGMIALIFMALRYSPISYKYFSASLNEQ